MPHIIVKMYPGRDEATKQNLTKKIEQLFIDELGSSSDSLSIGIEDIQPENWQETVVKPDIINKKETITKMPGYDIK
jgi:4-oxalocrotonate tautomerase